jgi:hypothetical protein
VVVAGSDEDPVTAVRRVHGSLDRPVRIAKARPAADAKHRRGATSSAADPDPGSRRLRRNDECGRQRDGQR